MTSVAVVYLARVAEGPGPIARFFESYRNHPAGLAHKLYVIVKAGTDPAPLIWLTELLRDIPGHHRMYFHDDIGRDIAAYLWAAQHIEANRIAFFNTFAVINGDDYLAKLNAAYSKPNVGIVGTTGSYESLLTDDMLFRRLENIVRDAAIDKDLIATWAPFHRTLGKLHRRRRHRIVRYIRDFYRRPVPLIDYIRSLPNDDLSKSQYFGVVPPFPNPHIRSNGFMCSRDYFLSFPYPDDANDKMTGFRFESGYNGLSHRSLSRGERLLVVDRAGETYDVPDWPKSGTFRAPTKDNLLVLDNTTDHFYDLTEPAKEIFRNLTYGGSLLGMKLDREVLKIAA